MKSKMSLQLIKSKSDSVKSIKSKNPSRIWRVL